MSVVPRVGLPSINRISTPSVGSDSSDRNEASIHLSPQYEGIITVSQGAEALWRLLTMVSPFQSISMTSKKAPIPICVPTTRVVAERTVIRAVLRAGNTIELSDMTITYFGCVAMCSGSRKRNSIPAYLVRYRNDLDDARYFSSRDVEHALIENIFLICAT
jgi:hypothetical protein